MLFKKNKGLLSLFLVLCLTLTFTVKATEAAEESCECVGKENCDCDATESTCEGETCSAEKSTDSAEQEKEEPVPESKLVTAEEVAAELTSHKWIILEYMSQNCMHCKNLEPEIHKLILDAEVPIYQINCDDPEASKLCADSGIQGFPTLHIKSVDAKCDYSGARTAAAIKAGFLKIKDNKLSFETIQESELEGKLEALLEAKLKEKKEPAEEEEKKEDEQEDKEKEEEKEEEEEKQQYEYEGVMVLVASTLTPAERLEEFKTMLQCETESKVALFVVDGLDLGEERLIITTTRENEEAAVKAERERRLSVALDGPNSAKDVLDLNTKSAPLSQFNAHMLRYYLSLDKPFVFVVLDVAGDFSDEDEAAGKEPEYVGLEPVQQVFKENRENKLGPLVIAFYMNNKQKMHANFVNVLGLSGEFPDKHRNTLILSLDKEKKKFVKHAIDGPSSAENIRQFLRDYEAGDLKAYYKSKPVPVQAEGELLQEVVGLNYEQFMKLDGYKAGVLVTYVPESSHQNKTTAKALEIAKELADAVKKHCLDNNLDKLIKVGTFDVIANEHEDVVPQLKPQVLLFNEENPKGLAYEEFAEKGIDGVKDFIKEKTGISLVHVEEEIGEEL